MMRRAGIRLTDRQRLDWLRLSRSEGIGPRTFQGLINRYGGAANALENLPALAAARGRDVRIVSTEEATREMEAVARIGAALLCSGEEDYPRALLEIPGPPPILSVLGDIALLNRRAVGIVGARNASAPGRKLAARFAEGLGRAGYAIVSGFARGIDAEAHRASLETGTIAVLAGGLDRPYPPENRALFDEIVAKGVAITEMPLGLSPRGRDFPRRNRLIAGLSQGVLVVEAARRSGSLITARMANEQGRTVFAVPGSPLDPRCEGTNDLLREGATIATAPEDIATILEPLAGEAERFPSLFREPPLKSAEAYFDEWDEGDSAGEAHLPEEDTAGEGGNAPPPDAAAIITGLLSVTPIKVDLIARMSGLGAREVQAALMELELTGVVARHAGNRVALA
jgi:DNA processing protein